MQIPDMTGVRQAADRWTRLAAAVDQIAEHVIVTNTQGTIIYVNRAFERITGYTAAEVLDRNPRMLGSGRHDKAFYEQLWSTLTAGKTWRGRMINRRKDGTEFTEEATITPVRDETGAIASYVAVKLDISDEIEREDRQRHTQKLEAVGRLAGGIAHDFNNILSAILGYAELAEAAVEPSSPICGYVHEISAAAARARDLVAQILTFSRQSKRQIRPVELPIAVEDSLRFLRATLPPTIEIDARLNVPYGVVLGDVTELHQLVMNLCTNAAQAIGDRPGKIRIDLVEVPPASSSGGSWLELAFSDTGGGMAPEVMAHAFEPFFTTKDVGVGTGLGLSVVHGIVTGMGGEVALESQPGKGTTVRVRLPRRSIFLAPADPSEPIPMGAGEKVLFVDDDPSLRGVGEQLLVGLGYEVVKADRAEEALRLVTERPQDFDLLMTDLAMPGGSGIELAHQLEAVAPGLPIVLMTGRLEPHLEQVAREAGIRLVLPKPFQWHEIARVVRRAMDGEE